MIFNLINKIDSSNAEQVKEELLALRSANPDGDFILDAKSLDYISSAGLRALLTLRKKEPSLKVINVSPPVYEIFEMTGFTTFMNVKKAMREISIEGCECIGKGGTGTVYRLDSDTIVKVFHAYNLEAIQKERDYAQKVFLYGIPTAISYDVVKCDDKLGIVFELLNADTLAERLNNDPDHFEDYVKEYARILKKIHTTPVQENDFPRTKDHFYPYIQALYNYLPKEEVDKVLDLLEAIPEVNTLVHSDFHAKNIMLQNDEMFLIDMSEVSIGNPIFDLAELCFLYTLLTSNDFSLVLLGLSLKQTKRLWYTFLKYYYETEDLEQLEAINKKILPYSALLCLFRSAVSNVKELPESMKPKYCQGIYDKMMQALEAK